MIWIPTGGPCSGVPRCFAGPAWTEDPDSLDIDIDMARPTCMSIDFMHTTSHTAIDHYKFIRQMGIKFKFLKSRARINWSATFPLHPWFQFIKAGSIWEMVLRGTLRENSSRRCLFRLLSWLAMTKWGVQTNVTKNCSDPLVLLELLGGDGGYFFVFFLMGRVFGLFTLQD